MKNKVFFLCGLMALLGRGAWAAGPTNIYHPGWIDLNKDGRKNVYEDASQPVERRVTDLLGRMTLDEKIGQLW
jgi:beta-glucosidase